MNSNELKTKLISLDELGRDIYKCLSTRLSRTVKEIASTLDKKEHTVRRKCMELEKNNLVCRANDGKPILWLATKYTEPNIDTLKVTPELATCLISSKEKWGQAFPDKIDYLVNQQVFEIAENVLLNSNQNNNHQHEWRFEQVISHLEQSVEAANNAYYDDLVEEIEKAILLDKELVLEIYDYQEPIALKPIKLKAIESKLWLIASTFDYPDRIKYFNMEDIMGTHFEDECLQPEYKMRWVA